MIGMDDSLRAVEAVLFAAEEPMSADDVAAHVGPEVDVAAALAELARHYDGRGIELVERGRRWHFQTAPDLAFILRRERDETRKLSRAAVETLAIVAYHEPVSRAEIEAIRGVQISKGTLDVLMEAGWVRPAGRREAPGRPLIYATTPGFLAHFGLESRRDLPGLDDLKAAGLLDPIDAAMEQLGLEGMEDDEDAEA
ncbi:MAG: SMC-Scp complex subunit ScpB [Allosphingosinicella sp.]